jgi:transcriptional regulator CtsR
MTIPPSPTEADIPQSKKTPTPIPEFMKDLQEAAEEPIISKIIQNIESKNGISYEFRYLTINIANKLIYEIKKGLTITVKPEDILNSLKQDKGPLGIFVIKQSSTHALYDWIQTKIKESIETSRKEKTISPYVNFNLAELTEKDIELLAQAIYGRMYTLLSNTQLEVSPELAKQLDPFKMACKEAQTQFGKDFLEKIRKNNSIKNSKKISN